MKITAVIADDHPLFRNGFKHLLLEDHTFQLLGEASDGLELLTLLETCQPQVVFLDIQMPRMNGIEAGRLICERYPAIAIVALSLSSNETYVKEMLHLGARGYLLKDTSPEEVLHAARTVNGGGHYYSPRVLKTIDRLLNPVATEKPRIGALHFCEADIHLLELLCQGLTGKEIGVRINRAEKTVEHQKEKLREKIGAKNTTEMAVYAVLHNLVCKERLLNRDE